MWIFVVIAVLNGSIYALEAYQYPDSASCNLVRQAVQRDMQSLNGGLKDKDFFAVLPCQGVDDHARKLGR